VGLAIRNIQKRLEDSTEVQQVIKLISSNIGYCY